MKTRILSIALIIAIIATVMVPFSVSAADYTQGDYTYTVSNGKATITQYNGADKVVVVPTTLGGYPVTTIGYYAFQYCDCITKIEMPSVEKIEWGAFWGCDSMKSVSMPNVTAISTEAFVGCMSLVKLDMPSVISIGGHAFPSLRSLTTVNMPKVKYISEGSFSNCSLLTKVTMPKAEAITADAFNGCNNLTIYAPLNSYAHQFAVEKGINFSEPTLIKSVTHKISNKKIIFTVTTAAGDYDRIKLTSSTNTAGYITYTKDYAINSDGDYVWTLKTNAPMETADYGFDLRSSETGRYLKDYSYYTAEILPIVKSVSHEISGGKIVFTVVTTAGDYNRIKVTTADNLRGSLGVANTYTVNSDGDYVWIIKSSTIPQESTDYAFDLRSSDTGVYLKEYSYYEAEIKPVIKSVSYMIKGGKIIFTVTTQPGYNRIKITTPDDLKGYIAYVNQHGENVLGEYVWTIKVPVSTEFTE